MKKLNIPSLETTRANFIKHASAYESFDSALCESFFSHDALLLQERLLAFDEAVQSSYLERLWTKSYLATRAPLAVASNFCFKLPQEFELNEFICAFNNLIDDYEAGKLEFKTARGDEIFARQFEILKGGARIPRAECDEFRLNFKKNRFFSILHGNNLYKINSCKNSGVAMQFSAAPSKISLAHLSLLKTAEAAKFYNKFEDYNAFFEVIENSRFNICIVNKTFASQSDELRYMQYSAPCYHYKTLNFIYNEASKNIYINAEHSFLDGGTIAYVLEYIHKNSAVPAKLEAPRLIEQYIDAEFEVAIDALEPVSANNAAFDFELKNDFGFSKDFIMQAAIAHAARQAYSRYVCQYEAVDMRDYDYGRTECVRAISTELKSALASFKLSDFTAANNEHKTRIKECKKACGIDRHLLGLRTMMPSVTTKYAKDFFASAMYKDTCETVVSTSSLGKNDFLDVFYFHPVVDGGVGVSYGFCAGRCYFSLTYFDEAINASFAQGLADFFARFNALS